MATSKIVGEVKSTMLGRSHRHWTPRYVVDRLQLMFYARSHPDVPWLCRDAIEILNCWLKPTDRGFEWGSGRSTLWLAQRVSHLTSVEHDEAWAHKVTEKLRANGAAHRVDYHLAPDGKEERFDSQYVGIVHELRPGVLDFCLVDGVSRDHCALACLDKLKPGGIIIIDNVERYVPRVPKSPGPEARTMEQGPASRMWGRFVQATAEWRCIWTTNNVWDTAVWFKP